MATIRDYLRLGRAQTAAVEGAGFPLAAWIGGAPLWALPLFALLGLLAHVGGFGENGITDLRYDRLDPSKATHPLVAGRMSILSALLLVFGCQAAGIGLFLGLAQYSSHLAQIPLLAFVGYIGLGHAYNVAGKWWKPGAVLSISGSFALAFLACGSAWTGHANGLIWAVTFYAFVFTAFQIAVAGELKELGQSNERNILRRLGTRIGALMGPLDGILKDLERGGAKVTRGPRAASGDFLFPSASTWELAWALSALKAVALGVVGLLLLGPVWGALVGSVTGIWFFSYSIRLLKPGPFDRARRVKIMGIGEALSYLLLVFALVPALWPVLWALFVALPVAWFLGMNRLLWSGSGSAWAPGV